MRPNCPSPPRLGAAILSLLCLSMGCQGSEPGVGLAVDADWISRFASLPDSVTQLRVYLEHGDAGTGEFTLEEGSENIFTINGDSVRHTGIPTEEWLRVYMEGLDSNDSVVALGQVRPLMLAPGERRHVDLTMYELGAPLVLPPRLEPPPGRVLHTSTTLGPLDGRVLLTGGFDRVTQSTDPECFNLTASADAYLFDVGTGRFHAVANGMAERRGGHTATLLDDGRVLVAGGASEARLCLRPSGDGGALVPVFEPVQVQETFEIFDPTLNPEAEDLERDGDPGRGGFVAAVGALSGPRFMHAAATVPGDASRVLLVGGSGGAGSEGTWEVFTSASGGVLDATSNQLQVARTLPSAVTLAESVWIVGGNIATANDELAEVWTDGGDGNGQTVSATSFATSFPNPAMDVMEDHPQYSLLRPSVAALGGGTHALVMGWLGPRCETGTENVDFAATSDGADTVACPEPQITDMRSFTVDANTGVAAPTALRNSAVPAAFGAITVLDDGSVVVTGGVGSGDWTVARTDVDRYDSAVEPNTAATGSGPGCLDVPGLPPKFCEVVHGRWLHQVGALQQRGILVTGGMTLTGTGPELVDEVEVIYFDRDPVVSR